MKANSKTNEPGRRVRGKRTKQQKHGGKFVFSIWKGKVVVRYLKGKDDGG